MSFDPLDSGSTQRHFTPGSTVFNRHELTERIGFGRRGELWRARDPKLADMQVALKLMAGNEQCAEIQKGLDRITDLTHPNIVRTYGFTGDSDLCAFILEPVRGQPLGQLLRGKEPPFFEISEVRGWAVQLFTALQFAWENGRVVHGDLRPANLFITTGGSLKVAEYCFAAQRHGRSLSEDDMLSGSFSLPCFSPQVIDGEVPTHTDDIYAAAACLYEALTGKPVFSSGNIMAQIQRKVPLSIAERRAELGVQGAPVPKAWEALIARCLAKERSDRPATAAEVVALIETLPENETRRTSNTKALTSAVTSAVTTAIKGTPGRRSILLHPLAIVVGVLLLALLAVQILVFKPHNEALAALVAARQKLDAEDAAARPDQISERFTAWEQFVSAHALKPIPFTDEDEAIITHASERVGHYQTAVADQEAAKVKTEGEITAATSRFAKALAAQKQADADGAFTIEQRLAAWTAMQKDFAAPGHPETKAYQELLAQVTAAEQVWQKKPVEAKNQTMAEAERMAAEIKRTEQEGARWIEDRASAWAVVSAKCADPALDPALKAQEIAAFIPTLAVPPAGTEPAKRAAELLAQANAAQVIALAAAVPPPTAPLKPAELLVDSPVKDQPPAVQRAFVFVMQEKLKAAGHYPSTPDGDHGTGSHTALVEFQKANKLVANAKLDAPTIKALGMEAPDLTALAAQGKKLMAVSSSPSQQKRRRTPKPAEEEPGFWRKFGKAVTDTAKKITK